VLAAPQRDDGSEHRQPQEQEIGELVRPHQRTVEDVARDNAGEKDAGFGDDQPGAKRLGHGADCTVDDERAAAQFRPGYFVRIGDRRRERRRPSVHANGPTYFSSRGHALSPDLVFISE
jgi:hypothetical protein